MKKMLAKEWRIVPGYPAYEVSESGGVRRVVDGVERKPYLTIKGYLFICMRNNGLKKAHGVHRLVALAFLGPPPTKKHHVAHYDGNKTNNHVSNLRWATRSENECDKVRHGLSNRGERQGRHVLTQDNVLSIKRLLAKNITQYEIADLFGVARSTVSSISTGKSWGWL